MPGMDVSIRGLAEKIYPCEVARRRGAAAHPGNGMAGARRRCAHEQRPSSQGDLDRAVLPVVRAPAPTGSARKGDHHHAAACSVRKIRPDPQVITPCRRIGFGDALAASPSIKSRSVNPDKGAPNARSA